MQPSLSLPGQVYLLGSTLSGDSYADVSESPYVCLCGKYGACGLHGAFYTS